MSKEARRLLKEIRNARSKKGGKEEKKEKKNPISTSLITICVQLLNALQAELHALCIVMRSVTEGSSSRQTSGESFKVEGRRRASATAHCTLRQETTDARGRKRLPTCTYTHACTEPTHPCKGY